MKTPQAAPLSGMTPLGAKPDSESNHTLSIGDLKLSPKGKAALAARSPVRYELLVEGGVIYLRRVDPNTLKGFTNVEAVPFRNGDSFPSLRASGAKLAKVNGVPFVDKTV